MASLVGSVRRFIEQALGGRSSTTQGSQRQRSSTPTRTRPVASGVTIEYTPDLDGDPDPGEVVWTWVPYEDDPSQGKDRPVVIIGRLGDDLAGVPLTSKDHTRDDEVAVGAGAWDRGGRPSFAKVDQLLAIDPDAVRREGAILDRPHFDDVVDGVSRFHDVKRS
jgi:hypothetical protein